MSFLLFHAILTPSWYYQVPSINMTLGELAAKIGRHRDAVHGDMLIEIAHENLLRTGMI